jgi:hypothetical protein
MKPRKKPKQIQSYQATLTASKGAVFILMSKRIFKLYEFAMLVCLRKVREEDDMEKYAHLFC